MNITLNANKIVKQAEGNFVSDMNGEMVMLNIQNGKYYNLGELGGHIWQLIGNGISIDSLVDMMIVEYEVDRTECEEHIIQFLNSLFDENLIELS